MTDGHIERLESALDGRYRIERKLGEGGMASVYLAEDIKHERNVALKVLKPELAAVIGAERFLSEIKTTANLQHPHILALFDSGEADSFLYYVMPYIEGETLRERIEREQQLGVDESVRIARDVADALDYAHRAGIIHRDIKPANILLHDGRPVVADFGIALAISAAGGGRMTETGLSLGTPHYMSPEQASADRDLSARSDVYSLGCVLYEMLAGQPPHTGPSAQSILVRILTEDPRDVLELRRTVPPHVAATVMKSIEKLPADRFESAKDFMDALGDAGFTHASVPRAPTAATLAAVQPAEGTPKALVRGMAAALIVLAGLAAWGWLRAAPTWPVLRADLDLGGIVPRQFNHVVISPDGSTLAVAGREDGGAQVGIFVRRLDEPEFRPLPGTESGSMPTFSPDGAWIAYRDNAGNRLMKVAVAGGLPLTVVDADGIQPNFPSWTTAGTIAFRGPSGAYIVPETGGTPERLLRSGSPTLLPGGGILITSETETIYALDRESDSLRVLIQGGLGPTYLSSGHLVYGHPQGGLQTVPFDLSAMEVTGTPVPVQDNVIRDQFGAYYSVSNDGTLVYTTGGGSFSAVGGFRLVLADMMTGDLEQVPLSPRIWIEPRYSPDGRHVAYAAGTDGRDQIFTYDIDLNTAPRQLTFSGNNRTPVWSPDGQRVAFASVRDGVEGGADLFVKSVFDDAPETLLLAREGTQSPEDWPSDSHLVFLDDASESSDIWLIDPSGQGDPVPYLESEADLSGPRVSPDGRFALYRSDEGGADQVYVRSFPDARQPTRVTSDGARGTAWAPSGQAIYHWNVVASDTLFVSRVQTEPSFAVLTREVAFALNGFTRDDMNVHPDGRHLLLMDDSGVSAEPADGQAQGVVTRYMIVGNWLRELRARMGEGN